MSFKIYTKTGDKGTTGLIGGTRISKASIRIEAYGTVDELNSWIGVINTHFEFNETNSLLKKIQDNLFTIGSSLACDPDKDTKMYIPNFDIDSILELENAMDKMNASLPELKNFVLPGGDKTASFCHVARCVCRRAERICVAMQDEGQQLEDYVVIYLNRLSDYLFMLSRFIVLKNNGVETIWESK
jgi:cob(I)alamin adenosyltransferase